jgi:hypothetical protein
LSGFEGSWISGDSLHAFLSSLELSVCSTKSDRCGVGFRAERLERCLKLLCVFQEAKKAVAAHDRVSLSDQLRQRPLQILRVELNLVLDLSGYRAIARLREVFDQRTDVGVVISDSDRQRCSEGEDGENATHDRFLRWGAVTLTCCTANASI